MPRALGLEVAAAAVPLLAGTGLRPPFPAAPPARRAAAALCQQIGRPLGMANSCHEFLGSTRNDLNLHIESTGDDDEYTRNSEEGNIITLPFHLFVI